MLKILLVRHAQCVMNLEITEKIGGRTNHSPLTPLGEQQARALGAHLAKALQHAGTPLPHCSFYSSTAVRAQETAKAVMAALEVTLVKTLPAFSQLALPHYPTYSLACC
jgi:broad specificity phosphatase PhoE